jgi:N6-adenosine-specific RNA methylase IME4
MTPAIPDPTVASIDTLHDACLAVREWADSCTDIGAAQEAHARVSAIETYLARKGQEGPAQEAARWLEIRMGELLGPAVNGGDRRSVQFRHGETELSPQAQHAFRRLAENRTIVVPLFPCSRRVALKAIKQTIAADKPPATHNGHTPTTTYPTIVIDPPWRYDNIATRGAAEDHYPTMSLDELAALHLPAADNAHLYLWTTNGFLRQAFDLVDAWQFSYKTCLTWTKPQIGMGNYFRNNTEHVLFAVRGRQPTLRNDCPTWFQADRTRHSAKPESFYDIVETSSPGPWLEMFARRRRFGWATWGNEA